LPLPKRYIQEILNSNEHEDKATSKLTTLELEKLKLLKNYEISPAGNFGYTKEEVTKGGINTDEINHQTFESLKQKNLYFIGECLNITGELGGFNFQIAFSEAYVCSQQLNSN
ncbi:MAG: NAD(P)/FAD-dependent oxidoreductase, partial [Arcobacter sp.]